MTSHLFLASAKVPPPTDEAPPRILIDCPVLDSNVPPPEEKWAVGEGRGEEKESARPSVRFKARRAAAAAQQHHQLEQPQPQTGDRKPKTFVAPFTTTAEEKNRCGTCFVLQRKLERKYKKTCSRLQRPTHGHRLNDGTV